MRHVLKDFGMRNPQNELKVTNLGLGLQFHASTVHQLKEIQRDFIWGNKNLKIKQSIISNN